MTVERHRHKVRSAVRKRSPGGKTGHRDNSSAQSRGQKYLVQFVVCGMIFVMLVALKLLLPAKIVRFNDALSAAMERNLDIHAVFSAVGEAVSAENSEEDGFMSVYQAVFREQETAAAPEKTAAQIHWGETTALEELQRYRTAQENTAPIEEEAADTAVQAPDSEVTEMAYVLYSDRNMPENVSLEQAMLGFDYCTPVRGTLSSNFGYREHPIAGEESFHYGIDLAADTGTDIYCFADGTVTAVGESSSYGKYCVVRHGGDYATLYAHCSRVTASSGATLKKGEKLAEVGQSGAATGPHLHFELQKGNLYLNPIYYVTA